MTTMLGLLILAGVCLLYGSGDWLVRTWKNHKLASARVTELTKTHDPESGYSYEWLAFNRPNKPSENELSARALEVYGPLPTVMAPMTPEYTAWLKQMEDEERSFTNAVYRAFLTVFQCTCGECASVVQWGYLTPVKWVGPCADKQWAAWRDKYMQATGRANAMIQEAWGQWNGGS